MKSSRRRYLLWKMAVPAFFVNVVFNVVAGILTFPAGQPVPFYGWTSVLADTLLSAFFVGSLTMAGAAAARLDARAGRVAGLGSRSRWLTWSVKHLFWSAIALGVAWVILFGVPSVLVLVEDYPEAMPRYEFLVFKTVFAGITGALAAILTALRGMAAEAAVEHDPRWSLERGPPRVPVYPFDAWDKAWLARTSRERGSSATPTWELRVQGLLEPRHVVSALSDLCVRYPSLSTKVQSLDGVPAFAHKFRYAHDPSFRAESIFDVLDGRDPVRLDSLLYEHRHRHLDLFTEFPLGVTLVITGEETCRLLFCQHHALADGRAFIGLLVDFVSLLNLARAGRRPTRAALAPVARRPEREALGLSLVTEARYTLEGFVRTYAELVRTFFKPLTPLLQNESNDYSGENGTLHWVVDDQVLTAWNATKERLGVSLNTLLTGALMLANQRVHRAKSRPLGRTKAQLLLETRPRNEPFVSFANHLAHYQVEADLGQELPPEMLLTALQTQVAEQRERAVPVKWRLAERWLIRFLPFDALQRATFDTKKAEYNLSFSNMIPLEFPPLEGDGWRVTDVLVTTPLTPREGIVLNVLRYGGKLVFNFNYKSTAATRELAAELCSAFQQALGELTEAASQARQR